MLRPDVDNLNRRQGLRAVAMVPGLRFYATTEDKFNARMAEHHATGGMGICRIGPVDAEHWL